MAYATVPAEAEARAGSRAASHQPALLAPSHALEATVIAEQPKEPAGTCAAVRRGCGVWDSA